MVGWPGPALARAGGRLLALGLLLTGVLPSLLTSRPVLAAGCNGDEQIVLVPAEPRVGSPLMVLAVSRFAHEQVLLLGPDGPIEVTRAPFADGFVWPATIVPEHAGEHLFAFGVPDGPTPLTPCADVRAQVAPAAQVASVDPASAPAVESEVAADAAGATPTAVASAAPGEPSALVALLNPYGRNTTSVADPNEALGVPAAPGNGLPETPTPTSEAAGDGTPRPTDTRRPTRTPTRQAAASNTNTNGNSNGNGNDNEADATPTRTSTPPQTPTPAREPTETRTPTPMREPTETRTLTPTREPTETRTPGPTREPTETRTPGPTREPTETRTPTPTREPTETAVPTATRTPRPDPTDTPVPAPVVVQTMAPTATRTPRPDPTDTPVPAPTATRTRTPIPTDTPRPTPTPTMEPPAIAGLVPEVARCSQNLVIRGQRFGTRREAVDGQVLIQGYNAGILSWEMTRIEVNVPQSVPAGNDRELTVIVAGKSVTTRGLRISC